MRKRVLALILSLLLFSNLFSAATLAAAEPEVTIINPYGTVDWTTFGQYKANFHAHSVESDGSNQPAEMFEDHYGKDFDIMALTDHNFTNTTWDRTDRPDNVTYLTTERLAEINTGIDRDGRGMIGIPYSNEQSVSDHLNTFWADFNNGSGSTLESKIAQCEELGGISHINHPGRYTGGVSTANGGADGEAASSDPNTIAYYVDLFQTYPSCVGMEIINKKDGDSYSDRILWDNILKQTMPERPVWGFSNDDAHSTGAVGYSYNMMLMPENTLENVHTSMENGTFYAVAKVSKRELGSGFIANGPTPVITNIEVDEQEDSIAISGENYNTIEWVANGKVIATGETIDLNNYEDQISLYVRAQLKGDGGISFTQPFGVTGLEKEFELAEVTLTASSNTVPADSSAGIELTLSGKDNTGTDMSLADADIVYFTNQNDFLEIAADGTVTVKNAPLETTSANIWAKVTKGASTVFSNTVAVTVTVEPTGGETGDYLVSPIKNALDDMEERPDGTLDWDSSDLEITRETSTNNQLIGLRFADLAIPEGATITSAYIQFSVDEPGKSADPFDVNIYAEATANAAPFENRDYTVSSRTKTGTFVNWSGIPLWTIEHEAGVYQRTPDLASLVQEIVDMDEWAEGNAISFILSGDGTRSVESFEGAGSHLDQVATLYFMYTVDEETADNTPPSITVNIEDGAVFEKIGEFKLISEALDDVSGIKTFEAYLDGTSIEPNAVLSLEELAFGEHQLLLSAEDNAGNISTREVPFSIIGTAETLGMLLDAYYEEGYITNQGIYNSLKTKLDKGNIEPFINELQAKANKKHISDGIDEILLEYAEFIQVQE